MGQLSVTLVDTPGFDDTDLSDTEVLTILTNWLQTSYIEGTRLCGMIYLHPITQVRMGNTSARNLKLFRKLCGDENLGNVLLVTNKWEICDGRTAEGRFQDLTAAGGFWRRLLDLGASAHRYYNDREEAMNLIKKLIAKQPIALNIQKQLVEEKKSLIDTDVGSVVHADLLRLEEEHVKEMNRMHEKLRDSQRKGNQELRRHLKTQQDEAKEELQKVNDSKVQLMAQVAKLQKQQEDSERAILAMASRSEQDRRAHALQMAALRRDEMESLRLENERRIADRQRQEQADRRRQALQDVQMQRLAQQMQQSTLRHQLTTPHQSPWSSDRSVQENDVIIAVMGITGSGKSTFISKLVEDNVIIGHQLKSCTSEISSFRFKHPSGRQVLLIDTPGFNDDNLSDRQVLEKISGYLASMYKRKIYLNGIIYMHRITDVRLGGSSKRNIMMFKRLCGDKFYPRVALVTTRWEELESKQVGIDRESELVSKEDWWGHMYNKGSKLIRHKNNTGSALEIIETLLQIQGHETLAIQRELVDEKKDLIKTAAGQEVNRELEEATKRYEDNLNALKADIDVAMRDKDAEMAKALREEAQKYRDGILHAQQEQKALNVTLQQLVKDSERKHLLVLQQLDKADQRSRDEENRHREELQRERQRNQEQQKQYRAEQDARDRDRQLRADADAQRQQDFWQAQFSRQEANQRQLQDAYNAQEAQQRDSRNALEQSLHIREEDFRQSQAQFAALSAQHQASLAATRWDAPGNNNSIPGYDDSDDEEGHDDDDDDSSEEFELADNYEQGPHWNGDTAFPNRELRRVSSSASITLSDGGSSITFEVRQESWR
ncbi:hypothetical protein ACHAQD_011362 [Fusarium lateritium]